MDAVRDFVLRKEDILEVRGRFYRLGDWVVYQSGRGQMVSSIAGFNGNGCVRLLNGVTIGCGRLLRKVE